MIKLFADYEEVRGYHQSCTFSEVDHIDTGDPVENFFLKALDFAEDPYAYGNVDTIHFFCGNELFYAGFSKGVFELLQAKPEGKIATALDYPLFSHVTIPDGLLTGMRIDENGSILGNGLAVTFGGSSSQDIRYYLGIY